MVAAYKKEYVKNAILVSYTSLTDFLKCPRAYYLKNIYRDSRQGYKLQIASPYLTLGAIVHDVIKWYLEAEYKPTKEESVKKFRNLWLKYRLKKGGFASVEQEAEFGKRGLKMLDNFLDHADVLEKCAPFLHFPKFKLVDDILLFGNMDFIGECEDGSLHVVDFKTGSKDENSALQLNIYAILAEANLQKPVSKASFWYLDRDDGPKNIVLDPLDGQIEYLKQKGLELKEAILKNEWVCVDSPNLCRNCRDYQDILDGKGEYLFADNSFKKEVYFLNRVLPQAEDLSSSNPV